MDKAWFGPGKKGLPPRRQETPVAKVDLHKLVAEQFVCFKCSRPAPVHVWLNGQLWNEIKPDYSGRADSGGVLCLYCMSDVLAKMGYKDGTVGLTISNGPFCNMKWGSIVQPFEDRIAELESQIAAGEDGT